MLFQNFELSRLRGVDEKFKYELNRDSKDIDEEPTDWMNELDYKHTKMINTAKERGYGYRRCEREKG